MHYTTNPTQAVLWTAIATLLLMLHTACTPGPATSSIYNQNTNFRNYQTYAWYKAELPSPISGSGPGYSTLLDQQVKQAVESELVKNGLRPNEETPDLLIAYDIALPANTTPDADTTYAPGFGYGYSYWYGYRYRYNTTALPGYKSVASLPPGTIIVDLIDPDNNTLIWRGWYAADIDPTLAGGQQISKAIANVMATYPPVPVNAQ